MNLEEINIIKYILDSTNKDYIKKRLSYLIININYIYLLIKEELGCKYYIRYMDDGIILMESKDKLKYIYEILKKEIIG